MTFGLMPDRLDEIAADIYRSTKAFEGISEGVRMRLFGKLSQEFDLAIDRLCWPLIPAEAQLKIRAELRGRLADWIDEVTAKEGCADIVASELDARSSAPLVAVTLDEEDLQEEGAHIA